MFCPNYPVQRLPTQPSQVCYDLSLSRDPIIPRATAFPRMGLNAFIHIEQTTIISVCVTEQPMLHNYIIDMA